VALVEVVAPLRGWRVGSREGGRAIAVLEPRRPRRLPTYTRAQSRARRRRVCRGACARGLPCPYTLSPCFICRDPCSRKMAFTAGTIDQVRAGLDPARECRPIHTRLRCRPGLASLRADTKKNCAFEFGAVVTAQSGPTCEHGAGSAGSLPTGVPAPRTPLRACAGWRGGGPRWRSSR